MNEPIPITTQPSSLYANDPRLALHLSPLIALTANHVVYILAYHACSASPPRAQFVRLYNPYTPDAWFPAHKLIRDAVQDAYDRGYRPLFFPTRKCFHTWLTEQ